MPERGPVQLLLHFLHLRQAPGWKIGLAVALVATLGLLPGEESLYQKRRQALPSRCAKQPGRTPLPAVLNRSRGPGTKPLPPLALWCRGLALARPFTATTPRLPNRLPSLRPSGSGSTRAIRIWRPTMPAWPRTPMLLGSLATWFLLSKTATTGSGSRVRRHRRLLHRPTALLLSPQFPVPST